MARDGDKLENFHYSDCFTSLIYNVFHELYNTRFQS